MARRIRALTVERVADLPDPCSSCALWELGGHALPSCDAAEEREQLRAWVEDVRAEWGECGRVAYDNGGTLGFTKYAPGRFFPQVISMPSGPPDADAVLIACLRVVDAARDAALGKVLLQATLRDLVMRREKAVEAYAVTTPFERDRTPLMSIEFLLRQGFAVVRPHPVYPLMRLELKTLAAWTDNVEAVLDALQLPLRVRERVPAPLVSPSRTEGDRR